MSLKNTTIETYNTSAEALAEKFNTLGPRSDDIKYVFSHCSKVNPKTLEIGCGNGRDAKEITKLTKDYRGIDISQKLIDIVQKDLPKIQFIHADVEKYEFPEHLDIIFAFASLLHVPRESFSAIMENLFTVMNHGGLVFISLKHAPSYEQVTKTDEFGTRTYWHYSQKDIEALAHGFDIVSITINNINNQPWIDVLYKKK